MTENLTCFGFSGLNHDPHLIGESILFWNVPMLPGILFWLAEK